MLRLTIVSQSTKEIVLKVDGWLGGANVSLLEQEGEFHLQDGGKLVLDLEDVRFIDQTGLALLRQWSREQLELRGGSPFLRALLKEHGLQMGSRWRRTDSSC
jgi:anti-anti-sigma regulatory factor